MENQSEHEIETKAFAIYTNSRKEHLKIDLPTLKEDDINKRLIIEWEEMSERQKSIYFNLALESSRLYGNQKFG